MNFNPTQPLEQQRTLNVAPLFNPLEGRTIIEPESTGPGFWAGAPSSLFDRESGRFYINYRLRRPLAEGRGGTCSVDESTDGLSFKRIWSMTKEDINSLSIERSALVKRPEGGWLLYVSYVDDGDHRWHVDVLEADRPENFDPARRRKVLNPHRLGIQGIKDPVVLNVGRLYYMYTNFAPTPEPCPDETINDLHAKANAFVSGKTRIHSGLATSHNGLDWTFHGSVLPPGEGWDCFLARITSVLPTGPMFTVFYDGRPHAAGSYEERTGIAVTWDLRNLYKVSLEGPVLRSTKASGSLRYLDALPVGDQIYYYYEYAREDGSHELRLNIVDRYGY